jgi:hypothetical protein
MTFTHISELLATKGEEYSSNTNRFENFLDGARDEDTMPEYVLWFMMLKHWLSLKKFRRELNTDKRRPMAMWCEKIDDIITYLILLKAMVAKRIDAEEAVDIMLVKKPLDKVADARQITHVAPRGQTFYGNAGQITHVAPADRYREPRTCDPENSHE